MLEVRSIPPAKPQTLNVPSLHAPQQGGHGVRRKRRRRNRQTVAGKAGPDLVFELATGASEISSGRLDTTKTTGHTSGKEEIP